jgi:hypothetical protein
MDTGDLNLPAYKYQLEQVTTPFRSDPHIQPLVFATFKVEIALKANPDDAELLKLKQDLQVGTFLRSKQNVA